MKFHYELNLKPFLHNYYYKKSSGDLENKENIKELAYKIAYTAAKVPVNPDTKDSWKRISSNYKLNL